MTPRQIELVQDSFALVVPNREQAATLFYARLFELAPETRSMFKGDLSDQGTKLMQVLAVVVRNLTNLASLLPSIDDLARRHNGYGVKDQHYPVVGRALIDTLALALGKSFTGETREAWETAYGILSNRMIDTAKTLPDIAA
ncbi:MAG TPA: globin family protein [Sphingomicrobium sp.]|jgi:nitric oxide dioxygenase